MAYIYQACLPHIQGRGTGKHKQRRALDAESGSSASALRRRCRRLARCGRSLSIRSGSRASSWADRIASRNQSCARAHSRRSNGCRLGACLSSGRARCWACLWLQQTVALNDSDREELDVLARKDCCNGLAARVVVAALLVYRACHFNIFLVVVAAQAHGDIAGIHGGLVACLRQDGRIDAGAPTAV